jgi:hypothetical protein
MHSRNDINIKVQRAKFKVGIKKGLRPLFYVYQKRQNEKLEKRYCVEWFRFPLQKIIAQHDFGSGNLKYSM